MRAGLLCLVAAGLLLSGCATSGPTGSEILAGGLAPKKSRLVIYRTTSPVGLAIQPPYSIDGRAVGQSTPGGFVVCHLEPGMHQVAVENSQLNVNLGDGTDKISVRLRPGQTAYLKAEPQMGLTVWVIALSEVTGGQGQADAAPLHKIDSSCI